VGLPLFLVAQLPDEEHFRLDGPEGHHAAVVQRLREGEHLLVSDGSGGLAECVVVRVGKGELDLRIESRRQEPAPQPSLTVVQALAKGDRGELAVQMMTEVGVDQVVPWSAARSITQWRGERGERALERWRSTAREATKQSRRSWLPTITPMETTAQIGRRLATAAAAYLLHEEATERLSQVAVPIAGEIVVVVGPEGGIAPEELALLEEAGGRPVRLGPTVLRTSTAGAAALAVLSARLGRW